MKNFMFIPVLLLAVTLSSCKKEDNRAPEQPAPTIPAPQRILQYEIDCNNCFVVYVDAEGNQQALHDQNSSWSQSIEVPAAFPAMLVAKNTWTAPAGVTARIKFNGAIVTEKTVYCAISGTVLVTDTIP